MKQMMYLINLPKLSNHINFFCPSGQKTKKIYKYVYDEKYGCPRRVFSGSINLFDYVQEGRDSVDFKSLGKMLVDTKANVIDHFISKDGQVIDITGAPRDIHEASKMLNDLHKCFDDLPVDLKAIFDNDFDSFRASYRSGTFGSKIEAYYKSLEQVAETPAVKEGD